MQRWHCVGLRTPPTTQCSILGAHGPPWLDHLHWIIPAETTVGPARGGWTNGDQKMAIILDDRAHAAVAHRRIHGRVAAINLRVAAIPTFPPGLQRTLSVGWAAQCKRRRDMAMRRGGDIVLYVDERLARYACWHDVNISAWRLGPIDHLTIVDEWRVLLELEAWEQTHPAAGCPGHRAPGLGDSDARSLWAIDRSEQRRTHHTLVPSPNSPSGPVGRPLVYDATRRGMLRGFCRATRPQSYHG